MKPVKTWKEHKNSLLKNPAIRKAYEDTVLGERTPHDPFWTHDTVLFDGTFRYYRNKPQEVRGKLHESEERYDFAAFGHSLEKDCLKSTKGTRSYVMLHPYIKEPNLIMSVALYPKPKHYADAPAAIGETTGTRVEGFRDVQLGNAQAWYYPADRVLVLWECYLFDFVRDLPLLKDTNMALLWTGFEKWLITRYKEAEKILTPWADPLWEEKAYHSFLRKQGYNQENPGLFAKQLK
jgi:hypothetical protein